MPRSIASEKESLACSTELNSIAEIILMPTNKKAVKYKAIPCPAISASALLPL